MGTLTKMARTLLANQNKILALLSELKNDTEKANHYSDLAFIAESGYVHLYYKLFENLQEGNEISVIEDDQVNGFHLFLKTLLEKEKKYCELKGIAKSSHLCLSNDKHQHLLELYRLKEDFNIPARDWEKMINSSFN